MGGWGAGLRRPRVAGTRCTVVCGEAAGGARRVEAVRVCVPLSPMLRCFFTLHILKICIFLEYTPSWATGGGGFAGRAAQFDAALLYLSTVGVVRPAAPRSQEQQEAWACHEQLRSAVGVWVASESMLRAWVRLKSVAEPGLKKSENP